MNSRQRGFSLIELMISVVIGLLAMVFVMRSTVTFETNRRSSVGGSDSMQNGVVALFSMENDAAQSGWGLNDTILLGCRARFYDSQNYANANTGGGVAVTLAPVSVVFNGANPDSISFASGTSDSGTGSVGIGINTAAGVTALTVDQVPWGYKVRDAIAIAPVTPGGTCAAPATAGSCCTIAQVSSTVVAPPTINIANDGTTATRFNATGGLLAAFAGPSQAKVFNLGDGNALSLHTWDVSNGVLRLRATDLTGASNAPTSAVAGIVSIKALYGFDTRAGALFTPNLGLVISQWSAAMIDADADGVVGGPTDFQRMAAVRLAVVARGREPDKPNSSGVCPNTTTALPTVFSSQQPSGIATVPIQVNVAVTGDSVDWSCYRYRVFETIVPLRNLGWKP
ncbi:MAG: prepilin-type N-terminal cleavage/methylation domain-containing protein [Betaproteobacteria bacterium]|nr:MAG: prepilin-type N-terminal cleavage/methylation domain-containing protein [Betaproteobacteria bacterium]